MACLACELAAGGRPLPGGLIHETPGWRVEHCVGPLGVGTLIVKPKRHVTRVSALTTAESSEVGLLLRRAAAVIDEILAPDQVYVCLWSHADRTPVHIHYVIQPVSLALMERYGAYGPRLQAEMFEREPAPPAELVEEFAARARSIF